MSIPKKSTSPAQIFLIGLLMLFVGVVLAGTGIVLLQTFGGALFLLSLLFMFVARVEQKRKQGRKMQMGILGPYPYPQQIIIQATPASMSTHTEVTRETVVKVRCKNCNSLNYETANRCVNCGASL